MQDRTPGIAEAGLQVLPKYHGDYPAMLLFSLRKYPKGRTLKDLAGDIGALPGDIAEVEEDLCGLEELGIVERSPIETGSTWRIAR